MTAKRKPGRPRKPLAEKKRHGVFIRLDDAQLATLQAEADARGVRLASFVREAALEAAGG